MFLPYLQHLQYLHCFLMVQDAISIANGPFQRVKASFLGVFTLFTLFTLFFDSAR